MKAQEIWEKYYFYTGEITKHARYLGFAGLALAWFFRTPDVTFPRPVLWGLLFLVAFFLLDLAQYYVAAFRLRLWMHREEASREESGEDLDGSEYWPPRSLDEPIFLLFHVKLGALLLGFMFIGAELAKRVSDGG